MQHVLEALQLENHLAVAV